ncbi:MAG: hypothetical protein DDT40_01982 [candidate division WS2 bacterium]|nr:hypothetical protein [Candidatus Psychracetigena formicireducens]
MGDDEQGHPIVLAEFHEQVQDPRLDGHVQSGCRLIRDQEIRRAGDHNPRHHALAHAPAHLVGVRQCALGRIADPDPAEDLDSPLPGLRPRDRVEQDRLLYLRAGAVHRIQRDQRVLEDHRQPAAADIGHGFIAQREQVFIAQPDMPSADTPGRRHQPHDGEGGGRLAATRLADQGENLSFGHRKGHAADGLDAAPARLEAHGQVLYLQDGRFTGVRHGLHAFTPSSAGPGCPAAPRPAG